jgi:hypothetical protein
MYVINGSLWQLDHVSQVTLVNHLTRILDASRHHWFGPWQTPAWSLPKRHPIGTIHPDGQLTPLEPMTGKASWN